MITARLLNSEAQLNNYKTVGGVTFVNRDTIRIVIQLYNDEFGIRHIPIGASTPNIVVALTVNDSIGMQHELDMTNISSEDKSIWFVEFDTSDILSTPADARVLVGGNLTFTLSGDTSLPGDGARGIIFNALQRLIVS